MYTRCKPWRNFISYKILRNKKKGKLTKFCGSVASLMEFIKKTIWGWAESPMWNRVTSWNARVKFLTIVAPVVLVVNLTYLLEDALYFFNTAVITWKPTTNFNYKREIWSKYEITITSLKVLEKQMSSFQTLTDSNMLHVPDKLNSSSCSQ